MVLFCHRCGAELPGESVRGFCAQCGAPQMILSQGLAESATDPEPASTGAPPPPRPGRVRWSAALRLALLVAGGTTLLFAAASAVPVLMLLSVLMMLSAASTVVQLYRRSDPAVTMNAGIGAQIGLSTGLLLLAMLAVVMAGIGVIARFRLHAMAAVDAQWATQLATLVERLHATGTPDSAALKQELAQMHTPEFRAWMMLGGMGILGGLLLLVSAGSGAMAGSFAKLRRGKV